MHSLFFETVIIGSGFAGRTVASYLDPRQYIILERGENRSHGETLGRYGRALADGASPLRAEAVAFQSDLPWNRFERLSPLNYSNIAMVRGGASNWWGGKSTRLSDEIFEASGILPWAVTGPAMRPWYQRAEARLNISGDPTLADAPPNGAIEGAAYWRNAFAPFLQTSNIYNVAINKRYAEGGPAGQGYCVGRGHCAVCKEDAKARPDNLFPEQPTLYETLVHRIEFEGARATHLECYNGRELFTIGCNRVVVAGNGIESPRLLGRSILPPSVNLGSLGRFCQDHAHLEIECQVPKPIPYGALGGLSHVQVLELSRLYDTPLGEIETSALALTHEPSMDAWIEAAEPSLLKIRGLAAFRRSLQGVFKIFVELEIPPQVGSDVDLTSELARVKDDRYLELVPHFDRISDEMVATLGKQGVRVLRVRPHYRSGYGGHHFVGTTNWSRGEHNMMEEDGRLGGTDNVYIAGSSVIPRVGGVAPTLTLVALAERLGDLLSK